MQIFVKTVTGATITVNTSCGSSVESVKQQISAETGIQMEDMVLISGLSQLEDAESLAHAGVIEDATVTMTMRLAGGKKKRKKKVYTSAKRIAHKHVNRKMAVLEYFGVDDNGKITKIKQESPEQAGCYLADHKDRMHCGKTGYMFYKLTQDGKRIAPLQNKPKKASADAAGKKDKKKKK